jgi:hypothetical protein
MGYPHNLYKIKLINVVCGSALHLSFKACIYSVLDMKKKKKNIMSNKLFIFIVMYK